MSNNEQPQPGDTVRCTIEGAVTSRGQTFQSKDGGCYYLADFDSVEVVKRHAPPIPRDVPGTMVMRAGGVVWVCGDDLLWRPGPGYRRTGYTYDDLMPFGDSVEVKRVHP